MYEEEQEGISYQTPDRVCHGGGTGPYYHRGCFRQVWLWLRARERLRPVIRNGYARATESDAEGDLQDFDEENLDEVELEADLSTEFDTDLEAGQGGYARATDSDADEGLDDIDLATASDARQVELAAASDLALLAAELPVTGDLWTDWNGNVNFPGEGTREDPYQIETLSHLMGLSEAVAAGNDYKDCYFELTQSLDLGGISINLGNWNPIGWYRDRSEFGGNVITPFRGHFDGCGNTITGLKIIGELRGQTNLGLFGVIDGGNVENLEIHADQVSGADRSGLLAGTIKNGAVIRNVTVSGYVYSEQDAGGIAAVLCGSGKGTAAGTQIQESDGFRHCGELPGEGNCHEQCRNRWRSGRYCR